MQKSVGIQHRVAQPGIPHPMVEPFVVGAFRQPDAEGAFTDQSLMFPNCGSQLPAHGLGVMAQEWEISVGSSTGEQIHHSMALQ